MRINCHVHVFNLRSVLTPHSVGIIRRRVEREIEPAYLGKAASAVVAELLAKPGDEEKLLRRFLEQLVGDDGLRDEIKKARFVPREVGKLLQGTAENLALAGLRRAVVGLLGLLRRSSRDDHRRTDLFDLVETLRIALQAKVSDVTDWLMREIGPDDACVPLMMDITAGDGSDDALFEAQLEGTSQAALAYPGRILPFVFANPMRPGFVEKMKEALGKGFVGVKLYPSLGYLLDTEAMQPVYAHCRAHGIPMLVHCSQGGFLGGPDGWKNADPAHWRPILVRHPGLKVCLAHFGGGAELAREELADDSWARTVLRLMEEFPGVYADVSFHSEPMNDPESETRYFNRMQGFLAAGSPHRDRILFGTDFWLVRSRLSEPSHWRFFERGFGEEGFRRIAEDNPRRFLGFPGHGQNDALADYARFVAGRLDEVSSRPAPWLVELVRELVGPDKGAQLVAQGDRHSPSKSFVLREWTKVRQRIEDFANQRLDGSLDLPSFKPKVETAVTRWTGVKLGLEASAEVSIQLLNRQAQKDEDGILRPRKKPRADEPPPQLTFQEGKAWLKYRLAGQLKLGLDATAGAVGLGLDLSKSVAFTDYRVHAPDELAKDALLADLGRLRFALDREDVLRLGDGEAVSFSTRGTLAGEITLTWADAFGVALGGIAKALDVAGTPLALTLDLGATVSARVTAEDDFVIVFSRSADRFRVALRKAKSRGAAIQAKIAAGLHFDDPKKVNALIEQLVDRHVADLAKVKEAREQVLKALEEAAEAKIAAGFTYEYSRIETSATLLEATLDPGSLRELHEQLVQGDCSGLLDRVQAADPEVELVQYLRRRETQWKRAWGFTLGSLAGRDAVELRAVEEINAEDALRLSYLGVRNYKAKWLRDQEWKWCVDFKAQMKEFRLRPSPKDFAYGLACELEWIKPTQKTFAECLDAAVLWGALASGESGARKAAEALAKKDTEVRLELLFGHETLRAILPVNGPDDEATGRAFAAAMPYKDSPAHSTPEARARVYGELWELVLAESREPGWRLDFKFDTLTDRAEKRLRSVLPQEGGLARMEKDDHGNWKGNLSTFGGLLYLNRSVFSSWQSFREGLAQLAAALSGDSNESPENVKEMFKLMEGFWSQTHYVRALGAYLLARSNARKVPVKSVLTIAYKVDGLPKQLVVGGVRSA